jgi:GT2 family glycosyltransferase
LDKENEITVSSGSEPKVIVLVLSYNGKALLNDSLTSYLLNSYENFEIVVIDNGSIDGTKEYVEKTFPGINILRIENNIGYAGGFNKGLEYAFCYSDADFALITNNDVKAFPEVIASLTEVAKRYANIGFVTGKVLYFDNPDILQTVWKEEHPITWKGSGIGTGEIDIGQYDIIREVPFSDDIFMLVSKNLYKKVGGYDEDLFLQWEEFDWQVRGKLQGFSIFYTYKAKILHKESMTIGKRSAIKEYYNIRNPIIIVLKHRDALFFRKFIRNHFFYKVLYLSLKSLLKVEFKKSLYIWLGFFSGITWGLKNNKFTVSHLLKY